MGALFATVRVEIRQLVYFHKVLNKPDGHWTKETLKILNEYNIGWAKQMCELLEKWALNQNWAEIKQKSIGE